MILVKTEVGVGRTKIWMTSKERVKPRTNTQYLKGQGISTRSVDPPSGVCDPQRNLNGTNGLTAVVPSISKNPMVCLAPYS